MIRKIEFALTPNQAYNLGEELLFIGADNTRDVKITITSEILYITNPNSEDTTVIGQFGEISKIKKNQR